MRASTAPRAGSTRVSPRHSPKTRRGSPSPATTRCCWRAKIPKRSAAPTARCRRPTSRPPRRSPISTPTGPSFHIRERRGPSEVFKGDDEETATRKLADAIFAATPRRPAPIRSPPGPSTMASSSRRQDWLTSMNFAAPQIFRARAPTSPSASPTATPGRAAPAQSRNGITCNPNIPTEEVFTTPHRLRVDGRVRSTKPLSHNGTLIENIEVRFEAGRIVEAHASRGEDVLIKAMDTDEGGRRLGEVALVPHSSPISKSGILFYNTLFDENAACHIALGQCYSKCFREFGNMTPEQITAAGGNTSNIHIDWMIGSGQIDIDGVGQDGARHAGDAQGRVGLGDLATARRLDGAVARPAARSRLRARLDELRYWRAREGVTIDGWTLDGAPIANGAGWPSRIGVHKLDGDAPKCRRTGRSTKRVLSLDLGGEGLVTLSYPNRQQRLVRARSLPSRIPAAAPAGGDRRRMHGARPVRRAGRSPRLNARCCSGSTGRCIGCSCCCGRSPKPAATLGGHRGRAASARGRRARAASLDWPSRYGQLHCAHVVLAAAAIDLGAAGRWWAPRRASTDAQRGSVTAAPRRAARRAQRAADSASRRKASCCSPATRISISAGSGPTTRRAGRCAALSTPR